MDTAPSQPRRPGNSSFTGLGTMNLDIPWIIGALSFCHPLFTLSIVICSMLHTCSYATSPHKPNVLSQIIYHT